MIDRITAQKIKDTADIVEVVGDYVHLVKRGANYMGLCPFHNERTPSFSVNRRKNICFCFSCKKGGSPVNFIKEKEGVSYWEALRILARKYGIKIEERELTDTEREEQNKRDALFATNNWAMKKMEEDLHNTESGRNIGLAYFYQRGVTEEAIKEFHLGYAMDEWRYLTDMSRKAGINLSDMVETGLTIEKEEAGKQKKYYDRYRGRVIFPILNVSGKVVGFGGRDLKGGMAKYVNSPESLIYKKNRELYGLHQAKKSIQDVDKCFLVEGYMDVIGMWQAGMRNTVASSGTALTPGQISLIKRFTNKITLIYDGDAPGIKAALRGINLLLEQGMETKVLLLPDGHDPDSFAKINTPESFQRYVAEHETDIIRFQADVLLDGAENDISKKAEAIRAVATSIAYMPDRINRDLNIQQCALIMNMPESTIASTVADIRLKIEAELRRRREYKDIDKAEADEKGVGTPLEHSLNNGENTDTSITRHDDPGIVRKPQAMKSPFYSLEHKMITYLVKYGMLPIASERDEHGATFELRVLDFVTEEMEADNMEFTTPVFLKIYEEIRKRAEEYTDSWESTLPSLEAEMQRMRKEGFDEIASKNLDMKGIEAEERRLEERLSEFAASHKNEFSRLFLEKYLLDHEDDEIRQASTSIIVEPYQLSNIYLKAGNVERDEDKLPILVPRAVIEWKTEIINQNITNLQHQFATTDANDIEKIMEIQAKLNSILQLRSKIAKDIGDRIIAPVLNKRNKSL
ncbi:MAG: DNA primase [Muribaculaceae bacterium]|nr:DNA primase [Muribaculaceae bacterium]